MTNQPGVLLAVGTADCVPVLVIDVAKRVVAAFHAGWRGTAAQIVERGIATMQQEYGSRTEDLVAAIGPSIGGCCYTVGEEVMQSFEERFRYAKDLFKGKVRAPFSSIYGRPTGGSYWIRESRIRRFQSSESAPRACGMKEASCAIFRIAGSMESLDVC